MTIQSFIAELQQAISFEKARITGYMQLMCPPAPLLSDKSRARIISAHEWSSDRLDFLSIALDSMVELARHGYPSRIDQVASADTIAELLKNLETLRTAVEEFELPPTAKLLVGPEVRV